LGGFVVGVGDDEFVVGGGVEDAAGAIGITDEHEDFGWEEDGIDPEFEEFPGFSLGGEGWCVRWHDIHRELLHSQCFTKKTTYCK
jgi:hypothetical protein